MSLPPHWCSICGKDLQSARSLAEHEAGRKHRRRAGLPVRPRRRWAPLTEEELFDGLAAGTYRRVVVCTGAGVSGVLARLYTQNVDGLHTHEDLFTATWAEKVVECHGSIRDGSIVLYGDALPPRVAHCLAEDFGAGSSDVDLVLVFGTSLQVAPFCAIPNLAPRGCARVLVNLAIDDCLANAWSRAPSRQKHLRLDCYGGPGHCGVGHACSMKLAGRAVQLGALWTDDRRWRQLLCGEACDAWAARFFASTASHLFAGSQIAFFVFPNMLKKAPMFKRVRDWKRNNSKRRPVQGGQARGQAAAIIRKAQLRQQQQMQMLQAGPPR
ncbi:unnamed protein product [Pelagomonas calceolata]|uniref:Deacetylase sirtuin-type domain-containing protein n=1 Tax=Pelagomonas calceolata TaxID=35677 RepID=A0A8J2SDK7_9STRA|nr:unnamed protein product [Pelagomonas calceolata]